MNTHATLKQYILGFGLSFILTLGSYFLVVDHLLTGSALLITILTCAVIQFIVQLIFFLHIGQEKGPRWNLVVFFSTMSIVLILVVGSIWIMNHLNASMTPSQMDATILKSEGMTK